MTTSQAWRKLATSKEPSSALKNFMRFRDARLQAESSTNMYSRARVRRVDAVRRLDRVPAVDRRVVLHAGIAADPRRVGDLRHEVARPVRLVGLAREDFLRLPLAVLLDGLHELVGHADRVVGVLVEDRRIRLAVERAVVAGVDQRPGLLLFVRLGEDELLDVGVVDVQDDHLRGAARLAARLDRAGEGVEALHEGEGAGGGAAGGERLVRAADRREVRARARAVLEEHALGLGEAEDRVHRVAAGVDEAGGALGAGARCRR